VNTFTSNETGIRLVAGRMIDERVRDAEQRRLARQVRAERRAEARAARAVPVAHAVPSAAFRFLHPIH
jgi:hypothetical protein